MNNDHTGTVILCEPAVRREAKLLRELIIFISLDNIVVLRLLCSISIHEHLTINYSSYPDTSSSFLLMELPSKSKISDNLLPSPYLLTSSVTHIISFFPVSMTQPLHVRNSLNERVFKFKFGYMLDHTYLFLISHYI